MLKVLTLKLIIVRVVLPPFLLNLYLNDIVDISIRDEKIFLLYAHDIVLLASLDTELCLVL